MDDDANALTSSDRALITRRSGCVGGLPRRLADDLVIVSACSDAVQASSFRTNCQYLWIDPGHAAVSMGSVTDHGRLKARLRPTCGLQRPRSARIIAAGHAFVQNLR